MLITGKAPTQDRRNGGGSASMLGGARTTEQRLHDSFTGLLAGVGRLMIHGPAGPCSSMHLPQCIARLCGLSRAWGTLAILTALAALLAASPSTSQAASGLRSEE